MRAEKQIDFEQSSGSSAGLASEQGPISEAERVRAFWRRVERYAPGAQVGHDRPVNGEQRLLIVSGWACDLRILPDGRRQIFSFLLPGDIMDMRGNTNIGTRAVMALTRLEVVSATADIPGGDSEAARQWRADDLHRQELRVYDQLTRMGRLSAKERVIHLLLELWERLERVGMVNGDSFKVPLTQEVLADALGLSVVHINRTLKELRRDDWVCIKSGVVTLKNRPRLAGASCYHPEDDEARLLAAAITKRSGPHTSPLGSAGEGLSR